MRRRSGTCTGRQSKADPQSTRTQTAAVLLLEHRGSSCRIDVVRRTRIIRITNLPSAERFRPKANDFFRGRIPPYRLHGWRRSLWMGKTNLFGASKPFDRQKSLSLRPPAFGGPNLV